ncbi:hypothetical protein HWV62_38228 [Athelia sp. TMB]|nr:hypothetical protein HWV62_38228 [Athelia sp. TMB]
MAQPCHINRMPTEVVSAILLIRPATLHVALVCKWWYMLVRLDLCSRAQIFISPGGRGLSLLRRIMKPTIASLPPSMFVNVLGNIGITLPPKRRGARWDALWKLLESTLPHMVRLKEITFWFRHKALPMDAIVTLAPGFAQTVKTIRLAPVREEWYDQHRAMHSRCLDPLDYGNIHLPWNVSRWPDQLASLGPVEHLIIVTNIPTVWPPVPGEERTVMNRWTSKLVSSGSKLESIKIQYHNEKIRYTEPRWQLSSGRYLKLLSMLPTPSCMEGKDYHAMRRSGEIISEEELVWIKTQDGWPSNAAAVSQSTHTRFLAQLKMDVNSEFFRVAVEQLSIYEPLLDASSPLTIFSFGLTCKKANTCVETYQRTTFSINKHLEFFLPDVISFRNMQMRTGAIISGSNVVQFMDRTHYEDADLDIYVNPGHGQEVGVHMIETQGFRAIGRGQGGAGLATLSLEDSLTRATAMARRADERAAITRYNQRSICIVFSMERTTEDGKILRAQIIVATECVFNAVMNFHSTCVMNVITYDRAVSFYPLATFEARKNNQVIAYGTSQSSLTSARAAILKYDARGFAKPAQRSKKMVRELYQYGCDRKVGDRWCWTIKFDLAGIEPRQWLESDPWDLEPEPTRRSRPRPQPQDPIMENKWKLSGPISRTSMKYCLLRLPIFKYAYAVADEFEAVRAWEFHAELMVEKRKGNVIDREWFDDNIATITEGRIIVGMEDIETGQAIIELGLPVPPQSTFPLKITEIIERDALDRMTTRYKEAFGKEEDKGQAWRKKHDDRRARKGTINNLPTEILSRILRECYTSEYYHSRKFYWPTNDHLGKWPGFVDLTTVHDRWQDVIWASGWDLESVSLRFTQDGGNTPSSTIDYNSTMLQDSAEQDGPAVDPQQRVRQQLMVHLEVDAEIYSRDVRKYERICRDIQVLSVGSRDGPELCMFWMQWLSQLPHTKLRTIIVEPILEDHIAYTVAHSTFKLLANAPMLSTVYLQGRLTEGFSLSGMQNLAVVILQNCTVTDGWDYACFADAFNGARVQYMEVNFAIFDFAVVEEAFGGNGTSVYSPGLSYLTVTNLPSAHALQFLRMFQAPALRRLFLSIRTTVNTRYIYERVDDIDEDFPVDTPAGPEIDSLAKVESLELHICHVPRDSAPRCRSDIRQSKVVCIVQQLAKHLPNVQELLWEAGAHCAAKLFESPKFGWHRLRTLWLWEAHTWDNPPILETLQAPEYEDREPIKVNEYGGWQSMRVGVCTDAQVRSLMDSCKWRGVDMDRIYVEQGMWRARGGKAKDSTNGNFTLSTVLSPRPSYEHRGATLTDAHKRERGPTPANDLNDHRRKWQWWELSNSAVLYFRMLTAAQIRADPESYAPYLIDFGLEHIQFCEQFVLEMGAVIS